MVMELDEDTFLIIGMSCSMEFRVKPGCDRKMDILRLEEGGLVNGEWQRKRILNGDEKMSLSFGPMPKMVLVKVYQF